MVSGSFCSLVDCLFLLWSCWLREVLSMEFWCVSMGSFLGLLAQSVAEHGEGEGSLLVLFRSVWAFS